MGQVCLERPYGIGVNAQVLGLDSLGTALSSCVTLGQ